MPKHEVENLPDTLQAKISFEKPLWRSGFKYVGGVDEVGRGCIAGPLVAACVVWPQNLENIKEIHLLEKITDSKKLSAKNRNELYEFITGNCVSFSIVEIEPIEIDRNGVGEANKKAMIEAINNTENIQHALTDFFSLAQSNVPETAIKFGDSKSISIAAASIVAKVHRDKLMQNKLHKMYPQYGFDKHVGYGTKKHIEAIRIYGFSPIHRRSFRIKL